MKNGVSATSYSVSAQRWLDSAVQVTKLKEKRAANGGCEEHSHSTKIWKAGIRLPLWRPRHFVVQWPEGQFQVDTWLILPVVICLSQRLSHASLSISLNKVKPQTAHYISYGSLDLRFPTWITLENLELIHENEAPTLRGWSVLVRSKPIGASAPSLGESKQFWADRTV